MRLATLGAALALLASAGCDRLLLPDTHPVYAAWEEGLTLGYEILSLAPGLRLQRRQQVRVSKAEPGPGGLTVTKTYTSLSGQWQTKVQEKDGGVVLLAGLPGGIRLLPEGFPDRVGRWESRGTLNWVVGRATVSLPGVPLADPGDNVGVWVESCPVDGPGPRTRTLFLPGIGEAETLTWAGGRWVATNILVMRGFTDLPTAGSNPGSSS